MDGTTADDGSTDRAGPGDGWARGADPDAALAELRADGAIAARRREWWLRQRLADEATVPGALAAAVGTEVRLELDGGHQVAGTVEGSGAALAVLRTPTGRVWVATGAVQVVDVAGEVAAAGPVPPGPQWDEVLTSMVDAGPVRLGLRNGVVLGGELRSVGTDAVAVRTSGGRVAYVSVPSLALARAA